MTAPLTLPLCEQVWFDDAKSSALKYALAAKHGLAGVGPYRWDQLDASGQLTGNPKAPAEAAGMWAALSAFDETRGGTPGNENRVVSR